MNRKLAYLTAVFATVAMMVAPAAGLASTPVKFGAKLNPTVQPSNSLPGLRCIADPLRFSPCTMVQNEAYGRPDGGHIAPKTGTIKTIRLIAGGPGTMRIETAKVKQKTLSTTKEAKLVHKGPKISYQGQTETNWESDSYRVESFEVNMPISKGEQLAIHSGDTSIIRCSSGGDNTLLYPLTYYPKHPFDAAEGSDGCWLLIEAIYK
ncbi:MAG TPA: hypothetical protein VHU86_05370 [Solirubrobacterales bacterium]|jgi:hypothetical protein|nr:hypothetical protein [Solirubrobacterales bacterium]